MRSWTWNNDQPTDGAKERMKRWNEYLTELRNEQYNISNPLRVFEAFAGYGSQAMALQRLKEQNPTFDYRVVGISEIDAPAVKSYMAVHGETTNYGDISKVDWDDVEDFDLFTYSFPCTDISNAGQQKGLSEGSGTRSSLLWEMGDVLWYLSVLAHRLGLTLEVVAELNVQKLAKRKAEGKIQGKGDNR